MRKLAEIGWVSIGLIALLALCTFGGVSLGIGAACLVVNSAPGGIHCSIDNEDWHPEVTK